MKISILFSSLFLLAVLPGMAQLSAPDKLLIKKKEELTIQPVKQASVVLSYNHKTIYIDPAGGAESFEDLPDPDMILITDINPDHFDLRTLESIHTANAIFVVPQAVASRLPELLIKKKLVILGNGDSETFDGINIAAMPMYSLPEMEGAYYTRGRGNGYVVGFAGKNIYISGETDAIPEMKELKSIDIAFVCMNKPYTMNVKQAAETVLEFKPAIVYPYNYHGADMTAFKTLVNVADQTIDVRLRNWSDTNNNATAAMGSH